MSCQKNFLVFQLTAKSSDHWKSFVFLFKPLTFLELTPALLLQSCLLDKRSFRATCYIKAHCRINRGGKMLIEDRIKHKNIKNIRQIFATSIIILSPQVPSSLRGFLASKYVFERYNMILTLFSRSIL